MHLTLCLGCFALIDGTEWPCRPFCSNKILQIQGLHYILAAIQKKWVLGNIIIVLTVLARVHLFYSRSSQCHLHPEICLQAHQ